ncbi:MAG: pilus assembly protein PilM [Smithellaceae bacterium]|nr:pilus assembly protein PilM [Smithellaceae bacterium]
MSRAKEISSTEKLLNIIRNRQDGVAPSIQGAANPPRKEFKIPRPRIIPSYRSINIGVDIGHERLRLVKVARSDTRWNLLELKSIPLAKSMTTNSPEFGGLLRDALAEFIDSPKKTEIWAIMSAARVDVRHLRIPKIQKKQIEDVVYWTVKKETPFDDKESIFDFEVLGEVMDQGIQKLAVMAYTAPRYEVDELKKLFAKIGYPLTGVSITPFAIQNIFRTEWIPSATGTTASLFVGNDFSRIDIFTHGDLVMTRGIKAGTNSMVEALLEALNQRQQLDGRSVAAAQVTLEEARRILFSMSPDSEPLTENDPGYGLMEEEIFEMILPAVERLIRQVDRTFEHFTINLGNEKIGKIFIAGSINIYQSMVDHMGTHLGVERDVFDPLGFRKAPPTEKMSVAERVAFVPALGAALSANDYTPNLMFTYRDKEREANISRINKAIIACFVVAMLACTGVFLYQLRSAGQKQMVVTKLEKELASYHPRIDQNLILQMTANLKQKKQFSRDYVKRYEMMAVIGELSYLTPNGIQIIDLKGSLGTPAASAAPATPPATAPAAKGQTPQPAANTAPLNLTVEGLVFGDQRELEAILAGYVVALNASPMFSQVSLQQKSTEPSGRVQVLHFVLNMKVG